MHILVHAAAAFLAAASAASGKTIVIGSYDDYFEPNSTKADVGDVLEFHFMPHNHSVVMGDFEDACMPAKKGGFYSGFWPVNEGEAVCAPFSFFISRTFPVLMPPMKRVRC